MSSLVKPLFALPRPGGGKSLRPVATLLAAALLALFVVFLWVRAHAPQDPGALSYPAESAGRMVDRHLGFYAAYGEVPGWQRELFRWLFGERAEVEREGLAVYREVLDYLAHHPDRATSWALLNTQARLLVLLAERGEDELLWAEVARLQDGSPEEMALAEALAYAYWAPDSPEDLSPMAVAGLRMLPLGWTADQAWLRATQRAEQGASADRIAARLAANAESSRERTLALLTVTGLLIASGLTLALLCARRGFRCGWRARALERPWGLGEGLSVLVRGGALGLVVFFGLSAFSGGLFHPNFPALWSSLFATIPILWLIRRELLKPRGLGYADAFGLRVSGLHGALKLTGATVAILAVEQAGSLAIAWGSWQLGLEAHWSETLPERLIWSPWNATLFGALNTIVWGPVFEEIGFRGLLYVTLRSRLAPLPAALISAGAFAALHPYSAAAMVAVFWSGLVWALAFERLRSLLPVIAAHAGTNLISVASVIAFYR